MNLNKFDMVVLVVMPLAIIAMSFTMPALGLGSADVGQNDIPQFDIDADRFDFVGDFPTSPADSSSGSLVWDEGAQSNGEAGVYLDDTIDLHLVNGNPDNDVPVDARLTDLEEPNLESVALTEQGQEEVLAVGDWEVRVELDRVIDPGTGDVEFTVGYEILQSPNEQPSGILESVFYATPLGKFVSGVVDQHGPIEGISATLVYIYQVIRWFSGTVNEVLFNFTFAFADLALFFTNLVTWLFDTYSGLITGAPAWAGIFVSIPGILLSIVLGKLTFVLVSLLPTT